MDEVMDNFLIQLIEDHADPAIKVHLLVLAEGENQLMRC